MRARTLGALGAFALQITLLMAVLFMAAFDRGWYLDEYARLGVYESCGADEETLARATDIVIGYLRGTAEDMGGAGVIDGQAREIFGADERAHMADVRELFWLAALALLAGGAGASVCLLLAGRRRRETAHGALMGMGAFIAALGALALWCAVDFGAAFTAFHRLLFSNGLWLMDPDTQFMIRMFPQQFFVDMASRIAVLAGVGMLAEVFVICAAGFGRRSK